MSSRPVLVVEHEAMCPPGWVAGWLVEAGADLDLRRPYAGEELPCDLSDHDALVVLGGSMGANDEDDHPWLRQVKDLLRLAAREGVPTLGICLGHQLCAVALGGTVVRNPNGQQIWVLEVGWTSEAAADPLLADLATPARAVQWNNDVVVATPPGSVVLARAGTGELQAARFAPTVWGVQWHPEAGESIVRQWADNDRDEALERGVDVEEYVAHVAAAGEELQATWRGLATGFVELTRSGQAAR